MVTKQLNRFLFYFYPVCSFYLQSSLHISYQILGINDTLYFLRFIPMTPNQLSYLNNRSLLPLTIYSTAFFNLLLSSRT